MGAIDDFSRDVWIQARQAGIQTSPEEVPVVTAAKVHFGIDGYIRGQFHFHFSGH